MGVYTLQVTRLLPCLFVSKLSVVSLTLWSLVFATEPATDSDVDSFDEEDEEGVPLNIAENGKAGPKVAAVKSIAAPSEKQVKISEPSKDDEDDDSSESSDEQKVLQCRGSL